MPIVVMGESVQCVDTTGNSVMKSMGDFDEGFDNNDKEPKIIEVVPDESKNLDFLFDNKKHDMVEYENELFPMEEMQTLIEENKKIAKEVVNKKVRYISDDKYI